MPDHEVRAFYDHEIEGDRLDGRRRRPVADWGVGEELFDHMPSRRRFRPGDAGAARRDVHAGERRFPPAEAEHEVRGDTRRPRVSDGRRPAVETRESSPGADATSFDAVAEPAPAVEEATPAPRAPIAYDDVTAELPLVPEASPADVTSEPAPHVEIDAVAHPAEGRRTVVIRGRGAEPAGMPRRGRPPRTVGERLGPRPDRVAAWAVAMGVLLILIAILTAH